MAEASIFVEELIISETFHSEFGDFALQSSDGPIFYFPRAILQYSSKVFATMFEIGTASAQDKPILIQADSASLDSLLRILHPGLSNPQIRKVDALANLLRLTTQYEMDSTLDLLKTFFAMPFEPASTESLITTQPLLSLIVSYSYGYMDVARVALREVVTSHLQAEIKSAEGYDIPSVLLARINSRRGEIIRKYTSMIEGLCAEALRRARPGFTDGILSLQNAVLLSVHAHPAFKFIKLASQAFVQAGFVEEGSRQSHVSRWESVADEMEATLPEL